MVGPSTAPQLPGYRDLAPLGRGGYSVVYRAYQCQFDRWVAVKFLTVALADEGAQRRFLRECRLAGRLSAHPNIVTVYDAGLSPDGHPYLSMELFDKGSIADRLRTGGPLEVADALRIAVALAGALETAHRAGVVHRDVKPGNVLLAAYGQPALTDFGLSILAERAESSAGLDALTPYHAAPEVLEGTTVTLASDVYSLASTTYASLAGRAPHQRGEDEGSIASLMLRSLEVDIPPIGRTDVPRSLDEALARGLARDARARTPTALIFAQAVQQVQAELGLEVTEPVVIDATRTAETSPPPGPLETTFTSVTLPTDSPRPVGPPAAAPGGPVSDLTFGFGATPAALIGDATVVRPRRQGSRPGPHPVDPDGVPGGPGDGRGGAVDAPAVPPGRLGDPGGPTAGPAVAPRLPWALGTEPRARALESEETVDGAVVRRGHQVAPVAPPAVKPRRTLPVVFAVFVVLAVLGAGGAYLTLGSRGDEATDGASTAPASTAPPTSAETPRREQHTVGGDIEVPTGLTATESDAGVQLDWAGDPQSLYTVLVLSETESPAVMPAEAGTSRLVPAATLRPGAGYCFSVALLDALTGAPADESAAAFSPPECIRGAAQNTVRTD